MTLSCNQAFGWGHVYHHCGSTSSNLRAGRHDSWKYLAHSICINPLIGLLPAASPVNNCWAGLRGTSGGKNTVRMPPRWEKWFVTFLRRAADSKLCIKGEKKVTFRTELLFQTNQSQVCVEALHSSTSKVACHSRFMVSVLCQILKPTLYPTHQVVA